MVSTSARFYFDTLQAAAAGLLTVLLDARETEKFYRFGGLSAPSLLRSGLLLEGDIEEISAKLEDLTGVVRQDD